MAKLRRGCVRVFLGFIALLACGLVGTIYTGIDTMNKNATATANTERGQTAIAMSRATASIIALTPTDTPTITLTPSLTFTPSVTSTLTPTETSTSTLTSTATLTPSITPTPTATTIPATGTAAAVFATRTAVQADKVATQEELSANRTATAEAKAAEAALQAEYKTIDYRELRDFPDRHIGEKVIVRGRIFNIISEDTFQMFFEGTSEAVIVQLMYYIPEGIYKDSTVVVYGMGFGSMEGQNKFGATVSQPAINNAYLLINGKLQ